ncbi:MAG: type II CRISPR RNA-guided endonuclease Cas9 [Alphaproteobacteria bacterium]
MVWRLGLDLGTNSIGWAALDLNEHKRPGSLMASGVRIFSDGRNPKDGQSLAVARRLPRQQRRRRDRYLKRRSEFMERLIEHGLMPADPVKRKKLETIDPWSLRVRGLDEELSLHELGRALFHLQQRRGFKSNRKTDKGAEDEKGKIKSAAIKVQAAMKSANARTLGEYLARPCHDDPKAAHEHPVRARLHGSGAKAFYDFYPTREMIAEEFDALWKSQKKFHGAALSNTAHDALRGTLLFQRPLKPQPVGKCTLNPSEERAPRALPSVQHIRIYQDINHFKIRLPGEPERDLTLEERDLLAAKALGTNKLTFDTARKLLELPKEARFNLESERRKHIDGDKTAAVLTHKERWGPEWRKIPAEIQEKIVERLLEEENEKKCIDWLTEEHGLSHETAEKVANAPLPEGHGRLGRTATHRVFAELKRDVITYDDAARRAGYASHSDLDFDGEVFNALPYYGEVLERHVAFGTGEPKDLLEKRVGKIANPTVHVALNQLRHVVNALMKRYGPPAEIVVELARDLPLSAKGKSELDKLQKANQDANDERRAELKKLKLSDTYENRLRLRLWEELNPDDPLDRRCPYTGEQIGIERLFTDEVEIDHILPFSRTLDDGIGNKIVSMRAANRFKGQKSPYEAFASSPDPFNWEKITERAGNLPSNKSWRFGPDAMERFDNEERGFLARQLNETRYLARLTKTYLQRTGADVWVTPGRLTADLRWAWGLDSVLAGHNRDEAANPQKNRNDHRHHAIDAIVVALTDRGLLQRVATEAGRAEKNFDKRLLTGLPEPWPHFREDVQASIERLIVSHKPDHGVQGALHNDTAYGLVEFDNEKPRSLVVHRVPLHSFKKHKELEAIRDSRIRDQLMKKTAGLSGKEFTDALVKAGEEMNPPVRKVRILETLSVVPIKDKSGHFYKAYKGDANYCYDIFLGKNEKWDGEVISQFDANQKDFDPHAKQSGDGRELIMRLRGGDLIAVENSNQKRVMRLVKFSKGQIVLADHFEAGSLKKRNEDKEDDFKYLTTSPSKLQKLKARLVHVDPAGRIFDPGPPS